MKILTVCLLLITFQIPLLAIENIARKPAAELGRGVLCVDEIGHNSAQEKLNALLAQAQVYFSGGSYIRAPFSISAPTISNYNENRFVLCVTLDKSKF